jgi:hypothetical protein
VTILSGANLNSEGILAGLSPQREFCCLGGAIKRARQGALETKQDSCLENSRNSPIIVASFRLVTEW